MIPILSQIKSKLMLMSFGRNYRASTWKKLATQLKYNMTLEQSLRLLLQMEIRRKSARVPIFETMLNRMSAGYSFADSMHGFVTNEEEMLISAGEQSGDLIKGLNLAANLMIAKKKITSALTSALIYPSILVCLVVVFLLILAKVVMPQLTQLSDPRQWDGAAGFMYMIASFVDSKQGLIFAICLFGGFGVLLYLMPRWTGKIRLKVDKVMPFSIYRMISGVSWLATVATLMISGIKFSAILERMLETDLPPYMRWIVKKFNRLAASGAHMGDALLHSNLEWPSDELVQTIKVYADLPDFQKQLGALSEEWLEDGIKSVSRSAQTLNTICLMTVGGIIILIVTGISSIQSNVAKSLNG